MSRGKHDVEEMKRALEMAAQALAHAAAIFGHPNFTDRYDDEGMMRRSLAVVRKALGKEPKS